MNEDLYSSQLSESPLQKPTRDMTQSIPLYISPIDLNESSSQLVSAPTLQFMQSSYLSQAIEAPQVVIEELGDHTAPDFQNLSVSIIPFQNQTQNEAQEGRPEGAAHPNQASEGVPVIVSRSTSISHPINRQDLEQRRSLFRDLGSIRQIFLAISLIYLIGLVVFNIFLHPLYRDNKGNCRSATRVLYLIIINYASLFFTGVSSYATLKKKLGLFKFYISGTLGTLIALVFALVTFSTAQEEKSPCKEISKLDTKMIGICTCSIIFQAFLISSGAKQGQILQTFQPSS